MPSSGCKTCALRSEEHTSELHSHDNLVCRLLLEKKTCALPDRKSTRLNSSHTIISCAVFCFKKQGVSIRCTVANLLTVDWREIQLTFFRVFPAGPLEGAPAFHFFKKRAQPRQQPFPPHRDLPN